MGAFVVWVQIFWGCARKCLFGVCAATYTFVLVWDGDDGKRRLWHTTVTTYQIARRLANPDAARQAATEEIAASIQGSTQTKARKTLQVLTASIYGHDMIADSKVARAAAEGALQQDQHDSDNDRGKAVV